MAEDEVNYSTVVFKSKKTSQTKVKKEEETVYDEVKGQSKATQQTTDTNVSAGFTLDNKSNNRHRRSNQLICCLGSLCVILLLGIITLSVYFMFRHDSDISDLKQLKAHQKTLMAENHNLTNISSKLVSDNEDLRRHNNNLTQNYTVLVRNITDITEENQQLKLQKQKLETQRNNLTEQIENMATQWNEQNVSRAQWTVDEYCPKGNNGRQCKPCQEGWETSQSSCYAFNNAEPPNQRTWEGARENCREKNSDLAVILNEGEKKFTTDNSWNSEGIEGYWIGLRAENGTWMWINGRSLTDSSWMEAPPTNNSCAVSLKNQKWKSVSCDEKNAWICGKQALSV